MLGEEGKGGLGKMEELALLGRWGWCGQTPGARRQYTEREGHRGWPVPGPA